MKHTFEQRVYYSDTDAYGVVWHGSYLRWLEMGRIGLCDMMGQNLVTLQNEDIILPVTGINIRYKASAKLNDTVKIETEICKLTPLSVSFTQYVKDAQTDKTFVQAQVDVVAVNGEGKLYRRLPEVLTKAFEKVME